MQLSAAFEVGLEDPTVENGRWQQDSMPSAPIEQLGESLLKDHFIQRNGVEFAGTHLLLDLHGATFLDDLSRMEKTMQHSYTSIYITSRPAAVFQA